MRIARLAVLCTLALLAACSTSQKFSESNGNLRITGRVAQDVFSPAKSTLSLKVADANGVPLKASYVAVKAGRAKPVHARPAKGGTYVASIGNARKIEIVILAKGHTAVLALRR